MSERTMLIDADGNRYLFDAVFSAAHELSLSVTDHPVQSGAAVADAYADWQAMERSGVDTTALLANHINHPARDMHPLFVHRILEQLL